MSANPILAQAFLVELDEIYASLQPQQPVLSRGFVSDLEQVYGSLPVLSDANLLLLAERFEAWRCRTREELRGALTRLPDDDPLRCPISLFRTMDYGRLEVAHTRTLAWLLNPLGEHQFDDKLLGALLRHLSGGNRFDRLSGVEVRREYPIDAASEKGRLDVLAEGKWEDRGKSDAWVLVIEAKIDAWEGEDQLSKYDEWLRSYARNRTLFRVFLTPDGRTAETGDDRWAPLSFLQLVQIFRKVYAELSNAPGFHFLRFYLAGVLQDVCGWPAQVTEDTADPYAVVSYLMTVVDSLSEGTHHDPAR
ncbi:MAG: PD-(D/E)XK nuclease family protein [Planctomycetes bacterium]|nr:PD-(D/E)XK nuclease family protein [Planctomycetota bacterium]